jgi:hypothetical protein
LPLFLEAAVHADSGHLVEDFVTQVKHKGEHVVHQRVADGCFDGGGAAQVRREVYLQEPRVEAVYIYIHTYIHIHTYIYVHTYTCIHIIYIYIYIYIYVYRPSSMMSMP